MQEEGGLKLKYGLKNNKEVWKVKAKAATWRRITMGLLAFPDKRKEADMLGKAKSLGLIGKDAKLEDLLKISVEDIMARRLQTQVYQKGLASSIRQARHEIVHGHIAVKGERMTVPGHLLTLEESENISFYSGSALADPEHPARKVEKKASSDKRVEEEKAKKAAPQREAPKATAEPLKAEPKEETEAKNTANVEDDKKEG